MTTKREFDESSIFTMEGLEGTSQTIAFTAASASSVPIFNTGTKKTYVLLFADQDCHIRSTSGPSTAIAADTFLPASIQVHWYITPGNIISVIRDILDGNLHISPVT